MGRKHLSKLQGYAVWNEKEFVKKMKNILNTTQGWHMAQELDKAGQFTKSNNKMKKENCMFF